MKHGCHNREPYLDGYWHNARPAIDGRPVDVTQFVPHRMTTECQTVKTDYAPLREGCAGCRWAQA